MTRIPVLESRFFCLLLVLAGLHALPSQAQWTTHPAPWASVYAGYARTAFAVLTFPDPPSRTLFASGTSPTGEAGLFRSVDDGLTWKPVPLPGRANRAVIWAGVPPRTSAAGDLYVTTVRTVGFLDNLRCDLLRSGDAGNTWSVISEDIPACALTFDPRAPERLYGRAIGYAATFYASVYRSDDAGAQWQLIAFPNTNLRMPTHGLEVAGDGTLFAIGGTVQISQDRGGTWSPSPGWPSAGGANAIATFRHPLYGDRFAIVATTNGLYQTTDGALTWDAIGLQGFAANSLSNPRQLPDGQWQLLATHRNGIGLLRGSTLTALSNGLPIDPGRSGLVLVGDRHALSDGALSTCFDDRTCAGGVTPHTAALIEYHNAFLDHYFMTLEGPEALAIDRGAAGAGWLRTGVQFEVYPADAVSGTRLRPLCRFYGTPGAGPNSHFYTFDGPECAAVRKDAGWMLETPAAFGAFVPSIRPVTSGTASGPTETFCESGRSVYRVYNNRYAQNDSNHRFVADRALYDAMKANGWIGEGVQMCVLQ